jgi:hypothetical protein
VTSPLGDSNGAGVSSAVGAAPAPAKLVPPSAEAEAAPVETRVQRWAPLTLAVPVFLAFLVYYSLICLRPEWGGDFQLYAAGVARLYRDMLHPMHEALNVPGEQSTMYTPFLVLVGFLGRLLGATPFLALQVAGIFNVVVFALGACFLFAHASIHRRWSLPAACFIFTTLCERWFHFGWSSETSLINLQYIQPFPSTFAWGLAFFAFGLVARLRQHARLRDYLVLVLVLGLLLSSHVLTASWVFGIVGLYGLITGISRRRVQPVLWALGALGGGLGLTLLWPYASFFGQSSLQGTREGSIFGSSPFNDFPNLYALAIPCVAYLWWRLRRHGFWVLGALVTLGALFIWRQMGVSYGNRYAFFAAFFPQFVLAEVMALGWAALLGPVPLLLPRRKLARWDRPLLILLLLAACTVWLASPMLATARQSEGWGTLWSPRAVLRRAPQHDLYYAQFAGAADYLSPADVVLMPVSRTVLDLASVTGASVVSTPLVLRVHDAGERFRAVAQFFDGRTSPRARASIARRYGVSKVLVPRRQFPLLGELQKSFGEPLYRGDTYAVFRVEP